MQHFIPWLSVVFLIGLVMLVLALRRRVLFRMAVRNAGRRKIQVALVILGLLIATSILSGSFVIGDSLTFTIRRVVFQSLDQVDEYIVLGSERGFFPISDYTKLSEQRANMPHVDGLAPRVLAEASVLHPDEQLFEARANLIGFDPASDPGVFVLSDGQETDGSALTTDTDRIYINEELAEELQASAGARLTLFLDVGPVEVEVADVLQSEGKGIWDNDPDLFMPLSHLQLLLDREEQINGIVVSNVGGAEDGYLATEEAIQELGAALGTGHPFTILDLKREGVEQADENADQLTQLFTLLGVFTIIAGLMLIMSIFIMLAEERKTEMGIQRAIGLRRSHLTQLFSLEGVLYAMAAAAIGALAGLVVAAVILFVIGGIFAPSGIPIELRWEPSSLLLGFSLGFLLTVVTIFAASGRISKLNIVRAIRNIPEPIARRMTWGQIALGASLVGSGLTLVVVGYPAESALLFSSGLGLLALGIALLLHRIVGARRAFTTAGLFLVAWQVVPISFFPETAAGIDLFIVTGIMMIAGGVLLVVYNNDLILRFLYRTIGHRRKLQPVLRIAIAYPMARRGRTGLTLAIFALVIFTIVVMAIIQSLIGSSIVTFTQDASGGYDVFGVSNPSIPAIGFGNRLEAQKANVSELKDIEYHEGLLSGQATVTPPDGDPITYDLYGIDSVFAARNGFTFYRRAEGFETDLELWQKVLSDPEVAVVDRNVQPVDFGPASLPMRLDVGDDVVLTNGTGATRTVRIVGILNSQAFSAFFLTGTTVREEFGALTPSFFLFKLRAGADGVVVGRELERTFLDLQMQTFVISAIVEENLEANNAFFDLLEGYLAMGLFVGIAGLGIVTMRNVIERRQEMGALRAIGFQRSMILKSLLIENSYVALLGILIGVVLGVLLGYRIWLDFLATADAFVVPWAKIALVAGIAYGMSLLTTVLPAIRAARLPPAEALRYVE